MLICILQFSSNGLKAGSGVSPLYRQDVVAPGGEGLARRHHRRLGVDEELAVLVAVDDAVGEVRVGALIAVVGEHPVNDLALLPPLALGQPDLVDLLGEHGLVVVLVHHLDHHPHRALLGARAAVRHRHLGGGEGGERERDKRRRCVLIVCYSSHVHLGVVWGSTCLPPHHYMQVLWGVTQRQTISNQDNVCEEE